ncbi:MAG: threonine--tRNA ligase [Bacilli bacterium]
MKVQLLNGDSIQWEAGHSLADLAAKISPSLRKKTLVGKVNGALKDMSFILQDDAEVEFITADSIEAFDVLNHSCAHLLALAVKRRYPHAKFWVGPAIEEGFYYDIDLGEDVIREEDLLGIEQVMREIAKKGEPISRLELSKAEALKKFAGDPYKIELIEGLPEDEIISAYEQGDFCDLCRGPHVENASLLKHFKLLKVSGAYYKGDAKNKMLQRIYGICFGNKEALEQHLHMLEEAKKRDHKRLGKELGLFMMSEFGPGFPFWLPKGVVLRRILEEYWYTEHEKEGYQFIRTPIMLNQELWETSGHWFNYRDNMYTSEIDDRMFAIKPMNCPGGILVYKSELHSYKELPLRVGELGIVHRHEASGALNGLFRVRSFTQDDAHLYMREDQIESEVIRLIAFIDRVYSMFGLTYTIELSTRPESKYIGTIEVWDKAEQALEKACLAAGKTVKINPGDGAFYGPKLDFHIKDSIGRVWQCGTIQLDMNLPERFDMTYVDADGTKKRPVMLHRVIFGSMERFLGILIEHYAGAFPLWLAPSQVRILPVNNTFHEEWSRQLVDQLQQAGFRVELDAREEKLGYRLRDAQMHKIPFTLVIGDQELAENSVTYRRYGDAAQVKCSVQEFILLLQAKVEQKQ